MMMFLAMTRIRCVAFGFLFFLGFEGCWLGKLACLSGRVIVARKQTHFAFKAVFPVLRDLS
jgi:hypothetical protein